MKLDRDKIDSKGLTNDTVLYGDSMNAVTECVDDVGVPSLRYVVLCRSSRVGWLYSVGGVGLVWFGSVGTSQDPTTDQTSNQVLAHKKEGEIGEELEGYV